VVADKNVVIILGSKDKELTKKRVKFAESKLKNANNFKIILSGTREEVKWMKEYSHLKAIYEDKSETTPQNLINSKKLIGNAEKIQIITDRSHVFRTRYLANKIFGSTKVEVIGVQVPFSFKAKKLWYELSRLIRHVLE
jgi:uncharacterized SAM-binding protein YcdF (DUF218 family)